MKKILKAATAMAFLCGLVGCASSVPAPNGNYGGPYVSAIELTETRGEVGKRFDAEIEISAQRLGYRDVSVSNLPEGLTFDEATGKVKGTPLREGFYTVSVAVRKKRQKGIQGNSVGGNWFTEDIELSIYKPIPEEVLADLSLDSKK